MASSSSALDMDSLCNGNVEPDDELISDDEPGDESDDAEAASSEAGKAILSIAQIPCVDLQYIDGKKSFKFKAYDALVKFDNGKYFHLNLTQKQVARWLISVIGLRKPNPHERCSDLRGLSKLKKLRNIGMSRGSDQWLDHRLT